MPQMYDNEGPLYVASPKGFSAVLSGVEVRLQGRFRQTMQIEGVSFSGDIPPAHQLALAVLKGDTGAALLLADLVQEQHTGSRSELQAQVKARVSEAVRAEREACANTLLHIQPTEISGFAPLLVRDFAAAVLLRRTEGQPRQLVTMPPEYSLVAPAPAPAQ